MFLIPVSYRGIGRKGDNEECSSGGNHRSWSLDCSNRGYSVMYNSSNTAISSHPISSSSREGAFLDWSAGTLSFFRVSSDSSGPLLNLQHHVHGTSVCWMYTLVLWVFNVSVSSVGRTVSVSYSCPVSNIQKHRAQN